LSERNRIALIVSCTPTWIVWPWLGIHVLQLLLEAVLYVAACRKLEPWRRVYRPALSQAWTNRHSIMRLRRTAQACRRIGLVQYLKAFTLRLQRIRLLARHGMPRLSD